MWLAGYIVVDSRRCEVTENKDSRDDYTAHAEAEDGSILSCTNSMNAIAARGSTRSLR